MSDWINRQVEHDFSRARLRSFLHAIRGALLHEPTALLPFEEVRSRVLIRGQRDLGIQTVPLDRIVGSEGRYKDFDRYFLPRSEVTGERWKSIGRAYYQDVLLPPVELYKVGEIYFVRDGNHRISVARQRGQLDIDARVIELRTDVSLTPDLSTQDLILKEEQSDFLEWTGLAGLRPGVNIEVSQPGGYLDLIRHINGHRYFLSLERGHEVARQEAIVHWYDNVYLPLISAIRRSRILDAFPNRTEADLYLWIMDHRHYLTEQLGQDPGVEEAVFDYATRFGLPRMRKQIESRKPSPEELDFLRWSGLDRSRPDASLRLSDPAGYATLRRHVQDHQYYMGQEVNRAVSVPEGAASWYDRVYLPVIEALERLQVAERFPNQTLTDLYLLVMQHLSYLRDQGVEIDVKAAAEDYTAQFNHKKATLLTGALYHARRLLNRALRLHFA